MRHARGSVLAVLLLVLAVMLVFLVAVVAIGARHNQFVETNLASTACIQAAEAGVHASLNQLALSAAWSAGYTDEPLGGEMAQRYSVSVTNNSSGSAPVTGPGGVAVPPGVVYLLSTGTCRDGSVSRQVAVMLGVPNPFNYALASGGTLTLKAAGDVQGNIKSTSDLVIDAVIRVVPVQGQGRVLSCEDLSVQGSLTTEGDQDIRARGDITGTSKIHGTTLIYDHDLSPDTEPFLMDGATTPEGAPEGYEVMPNPDMDELLVEGQYESHPGHMVYGGKEKVLDLQGQVHYFPDGVRFGPGSSIVGSGTIVVGNANSAVFDIPLDKTVNILAVDGSNGTVGGSEIYFNGPTRIRGLVFCHGSIYAKSDFRVEGRVITYGEGESIYSGAHLEVVMDPVAAGCPGFSAFFGTGTTPGGLGILSWQRL